MIQTRVSLSQVRHDNLYTTRAYTVYLTKNSGLEYIVFNINSVFSLVAIIAIIARSLKLLCLQYTRQL